MSWRDWGETAPATLEAIVTEEPDSLILRMLRRLDEQMSGLREDNREIKSRLGNFEQQYASLSNGVDRIEVKIDRIERRLELAEA